MLDKFINKLSKYSKIADNGREVEKRHVEPEQIRIAKFYHGWSEAGHPSDLRALLGFDAVSTPWCAGFVNAIEKKCGRKGTGSLLARSFLKYGAKTNAPMRLGDIVVFSRGKFFGHVGYYISEDEKNILVLGGNQSNKVCYKYYPKSRLIGHRIVTYI